MQYVRLGSSGLKVSRLALGCMSYGEPGLGTHPWSLPEEESLPFLAQALDLGITFFDTANIYSLGTSEEFLGRGLRKLTRREDVVIATKVYEKLDHNPLSGGLSRSAVIRELEASLRRLDTDYVDLYIVHRWDPHTPIEETMEALHDVVRAGKVRYIGASSMHTWQFVKAQYVADLHGWTRFVSMQNHYNLINREEEREMLPYCLAEGIGVTPWSPLARGRLARDWETESVRTAGDPIQERFYAPTEEADRAVTRVVAQVAAERGVPMAQVALAWLLRQPAVTAPVVGATKPHHLQDAVAALELELDDTEAARLAAPYVPHAVVEYV
ncbi:aldo/keto reductase [Streptomyces rochei]|uniref:Aldo/keto reductase n=3 Tax=Streptomyces rochei group TaxID=2867164 RepID=A0AAX3ZL69_STRRO|nr:MULTISPECIES: aldo/keto reductase [Streptomyces]MBQ0881975.1 aldo/keto reductase [Streptomyces sp. RT42]UXI79834.1 aldo/keto reductase [Streptomyces vinaceusdrappus]WMC87496.1 aldo/keto reductase [Streptomyces rochei]